MAALALVWLVVLLIAGEQAFQYLRTAFFDFWNAAP